MAALDLPQYAQVKRKLIAEIRSGQWPVGGPFPSEAELVLRYKVSRSTLVRSLQDLVREGYLYRRQGQGTFVADFRHKQGTTTPIPLFMHGHAPSSKARASLVMMKMLSGMEEALGAGLPGITVRQVALGTFDDDTRRLIETLKPRVAIVVEPSYSPQMLLALRKIGCIIWSMNEPFPDVNCVYIDQERSGHMATKHLLDRGRRRIALLNGPVDAYWGFAAKLAGYRRALEEAGVPFDPKLVREGSHVVDSEAGRTMIRGLVEDGVDFDGLVGVSDAKAIGAMAAAKELGRRMPDDLTVIGIDNTIADEADPPLTSVSMPFEEVGRQTALRAKESLEDVDAPGAVEAVQQIRLQPTLELRGARR